MPKGRLAVHLGAGFSLELGARKSKAASIGGFFHSGTSAGPKETAPAEGTAACKSSWLAVLVATNFMVGRCNLACNPGSDYTDLLHFIT